MYAQYTHRSAMYENYSSNACKKLAQNKTLFICFVLVRAHCIVSDNERIIMLVQFCVHRQNLLLAKYISVSTCVTDNNTYVCMDTTTEYKYESAVNGTYMTTTMSAIFVEHTTDTYIRTIQIALLVYRLYIHSRHFFFLSENNFLAILQFCSVWFSIISQTNFEYKNLLWSSKLWKIVFYSIYYCERLKIRKGKYVVLHDKVTH